MREMDRIILSMTGQETRTEDIDEFPLPVAEQWDELLARSVRMAEAIDKHLDFESKLQGRELRPITLCPEQKVSMVSDLTAI